MLTGRTAVLASVHKRVTAFPHDPTSDTHGRTIYIYHMLRYVTLRYVTLRYVTLRYVMLCYVMLCYVMLCYVMLCYVVINRGYTTMHMIQPQVTTEAV